MSYEVFGGGDEIDWGFRLDRDGWVSDPDGKVWWQDWEPEVTYTFEEACSAWESKHEED